ncbi:uncharacterized protein LOC111244165 [Varroa destructor]|uniref:Small ribosomal subunit protein mS38 n=1 Tax=Varroa destructor TaxID=109461 RepID=A0A7M7JEE6_VARDE|nr:uncharacterized protein LOC111244165 [Varroa destructor]
MLRRSLMQVTGGVSRSFHCCTSANIGLKSSSAQTIIATAVSTAERNSVLSSLPPLALPSTPFITLIKAPRISPFVINPARILPSAIKPEVEIPYLHYKGVTLPNLGNVKTPIKEPKTTSNEMRCAVLVQIRKKKMKKHQRRKLRKRMRFLIQKTEMRRLKKKEADFKTELLAKLDEAKQFDAEAFIKEALQKIRHKHEHIETPEQRKERIKELYRKYRSNVRWIRPKLDD